MKKTLFTLTLLMTFIISHAQQTSKKSDPSLTERFTFISPKKDTLYLANNSVGILTKWIWDNDKTIKVKKPYVVIIPEKQLWLIIESREKKENLTASVKD